MKDFIIVTTPVYITIFWAVVFLTGDLFHNKAKFMLGLFMFITALLFSCQALFFLDYRELYLSVDALYIFTSLSVYPLYYWYIKLLTVESRLDVYNLLHFIPALFLSVLLELFNILATPEEQLKYLSEVLYDNHLWYITAPGNIGWMARIFFASRLVFYVQVLYCLLSGFRLATIHNKRIEDFYSNLENRRLVWVKLITLSLLAASLASIVFNLLGRGVFIANGASRITASIVFSSVVFIAGLLGNKQNNTVMEIADEIGVLPHHAWTEKSHEMIRDRLEELLVMDRMYLIPDLKITTISKVLNTNRTYVSNIINEENGCNFNTYINRFRINHALQLMNKRGAGSLVIEHIAEESGFGSLSSFIRAFKAIKGITPGRYLQEMRIQNQ